MKIIIAAGGSGGHIFPALALSQKLKERGDIEVLFAASKRALDKKMLEGADFRKIFFSVNPMPYRFGIKAFSFAAKTVSDFFLSLFVLLKERPDVVVGFGGYTAGTMVALASLMGIKTVIHEQNLFPGRANRMLDKFASAVAVSFEDTRKYFRNTNIVFTGNPLRETVVSKSQEARSEILGLDKNKFTILVMGGSQGARSLNALVSDAIIEMRRDMLNNIQVVHIAGPKDHEMISALYKENGIASKTFSFMENIHEAYCICDLAISRSGAAAIFELSVYAKPMILIPYPFSRNNQRHNAKYFAEKKAAVYMEEKELNSARLKYIIEDLVGNKEKLDNLSENARRMACPDAAARLAGEILNLTGTKRMKRS